MSRHVGRARRLAVGRKGMRPSHFSVTKLGEEMAKETPATAPPHAPQTSWLRHWPWERIFLFAQAVTSLVSVAVALFAISATLNVTRANDEAESARHEALEDRQNAAMARAEAHAANREMAALDRERDMAESHLAMVQADLSTRLHDLSLARSDLAEAQQESHRLELAGAVAERQLDETRQARQLAEQEIETAQLSMAVVRILESQRLEVDGYDSSYSLLQGNLTSSQAPIDSRRYEIFNQEIVDPRFCQLPGGGTVVARTLAGLQDVREDPFMQALCQGLSKPTFGMTLDVWALNQMGVPVSRPYVWMNHGSSYSIGVLPYSLDGLPYSDIQIRSFWGELETQLLVGFYDRTDSLTTDRPPFSSRTVEMINNFHESWGSFSQRLTSDEYDQALQRLAENPSAPWQVLQIERPTVPSSGDERVDALMERIIERDAPPRLQPVPEAGVDLIHSGFLPFTSRFDSALICAAAWHAELQGLIERRDRVTICTSVLYSRGR
ncbi:hypothetical protein [Brevundimonas sp.]|uniref:hypothetical protein n=1 Tax=Brevundimonas sp. TaxID=1871086 RepID=UPI002737F8B1|nr:hypothetical protein [Brevundimonas sp.]MDP3802084.1 hypothetical protein [Brevundimonas sp.]